MTTWWQYSASSSFSKNSKKNCQKAELLVCTTPLEKSEWNFSAISRDVYSRYKSSTTAKIKSLSSLSTQSSIHSPTVSAIQLWTRSSEKPTEIKSCPSYLTLVPSSARLNLLIVCSKSKEFPRRTWTMLLLFLRVCRLFFASTWWCTTMWSSTISRPIIPLLVWLVSADSLSVWFSFLWV